MNREQISALMDGELDDARAQAWCSQLKSDESCACWAAYHLIGDALRGDCLPPSDFSRRFAERLAAEPTVLAPGNALAPGAVGGLPWRSAIRHRPWYYGMAAAASVAAVGVVGWFGVQEFSLGPALSERAGNYASPSSTVLATSADTRSVAAMIRRAQSQGLNSYLMVHQEYSPTTAMQGVRPYVRTVTDMASAE
ncbi:MAG: sigma-E factor negative regulatory protein [Betaproteobacteria bacterium]